MSITYFIINLYNQKSRLMRSIIALLLLIACCSSRSAFGNDFKSSQFELKLTSNNQSKLIPQLFDCSCDLKVFQVVNNNYKIKIKALVNTFTHVKLKSMITQKCSAIKLNEYHQGEANMILVEEDHKDEETQTYFVELANLTNIDQQRCLNIEENGEERKVYLIIGNQQKFNYDINVPQNAMWLTQVTAFVVLLALCHNIKYRRFTPFRFGFIFAIFYSMFLFATVYIQTYVQDDLQITFWCVMAFSTFCMTLYFIDLTSICLDKTPIIIGISIAIALLISLIDTVILPDAWFINNLIAILVAGALIKFVVIKKLKAAILPLIFLWLFFILRQFAISFHFQNFQQALQIKIVPLFMQMPAMFNDDERGYICSAFGTSKIITMGLIVNYGVRVDLFISSRFYTFLTSLVSLTCLAVELGISILSDELPVMEYISVIMFIPISFAVMLLFASKRGEWAEVWHGSFHDIAVDRRSVKRQTMNIDDDSIDKSLDSLKMNPSLLSDN